MRSDKTLEIIKNQEAAFKDKLDPERLALDKLIDEITTAIGKRTLELQAADEAQEARSNLISWIGDALVMLSLLGAAVFVVLSIARPVSRIAAVLQQLSGGDKGVKIPYADRGDEVGEAARAAATFRDNLARIETMEAEQKESQARALAEHRAELERLADGFDAAVGEIVGAVSSSATHLQSAATTLGKNAATTQQLAATVADKSDGVRKRSLGGDCGGTNGGLDRGDRAPGAAIEPDRRGGGAASRRDRCAHGRAVAGGATHRRRHQADHHDC